MIIEVLMLFPLLNGNVGRGDPSPAILRVLWRAPLHAHVSIAEGAVTRSTQHTLGAALLVDTLGTTPMD
jgi:hypothetical protein